MNSPYSDPDLQISSHEKSSRKIVLIMGATILIYSLYILISALTGGGFLNLLLMTSPLLFLALFLLHNSIKQFKSYALLGETPLNLDSKVILGGKLSGCITIEKADFNRVEKLTLVNVEQIYRHKSQDVRNTLYTKELIPEIVHSDGATKIAFDFEIPSENKQSSSGSLTKPSYYWLLSLSVEDKTSSRSWDIPVSEY